MTADDFRDGANRLWGVLDRMALAGVIAFASYLFMSQQELRSDVGFVSERAAIIETIISQGPQGGEIVSRLSTIEAEIRGLRNAIDRESERQRSRPR